MKKAFKVLSLIIACGIGGLLIFFWYARRGGEQNARDVDEMCLILPGTTKDEVLAKAKFLNFEPDRQPVLGKGIDVRSEGDQEIIRVGKYVMKPFVRAYCSLTLKEGKVISTKKFSLD